MAQRFHMLVLVFVGLIVVASGEADFDCSGRVSGVCRAPSNCIEEYNDRCLSGRMEEATDRDARCCPDPLRVLTENDFQDRASMCNNRKCLLYYNGWWATLCPNATRTLFYCNLTRLHCCGAACKILPGCISRGGYCVSQVNKCQGAVYSKLCDGYRCHCCVPQNSTTTTPATTKTTTTTPVSTNTTTMTNTTTSSTTTTLTASNTTTSSSSTTKTSTSTTTGTTTTGSTLSPCPITGVSVSSLCTLPKTCNASGNATQMICPYSNCPPVKVRCCPGGYTAIVYRNLNATRCNFTKSWVEYKQGFCDAQAGEYWLGNEVVYALTKDKPSSLMMWGKNSSESIRVLYYQNFSVANEANKYKASLSGFNSTQSIGIDILVNPPTGNAIFNGMNFSTYDQDNDVKAAGSCSITESEKGGWWFNDCTNIKATRNTQVDWYFWNAPEYAQSLMSEYCFGIKPNV